MEKDIQEQKIDARLLKVTQHTSFEVHRYCNTGTKTHYIEDKFIIHQYCDPTGGGVCIEKLGFYIEDKKFKKNGILG